MSDFSELCPLFSTGVFSEVTFPNIPMTAVSTTSNALSGTLPLTVSADRAGVFTFGRTVIVTGAYIRQFVNPTATMYLKLHHRTSLRATGTEFATIMCNISASGVEPGYTWNPMAVATATTFTSSEVLALTVGTSTTSGGGQYDLMVRYKEK